MILGKQVQLNFPLVSTFVLQVTGFFVTKNFDEKIELVKRSTLKLTQI